MNNRQRRSLRGYCDVYITSHSETVIFFAKWSRRRHKLRNCFLSSFSVRFDIVLKSNSEISLKRYFYTIRPLDKANVLDLQKSNRIRKQVVIVRFSFLCRGLKEGII